MVSRSDPRPTPGSTICLSTRRCASTTASEDRQFDSLRIKSDTSRGGEVYDVLYKNICINHGGDTIVIDPTTFVGDWSLIPNFHDITFSNVRKLIHDSAHKSTMTGYNTAGIVNPLA